MLKVSLKTRQKTCAIYTRMGNGTESTYAYDRQRERLQGMLLTANGDSIMQTQYKYDPVDNILGISNVITPKAPKKPKGFGGFGRTDGMGGLDAGKEKKEKPLGGAFSHTYAYDELNRLIRAEGKAKGLGYVMDMSFGLMGEPLTKVQRTDSGSVAGSYALAYEYGDADHPTAPSQIGHERYVYDANGNPTLVEDDSLNTERRMAWDEENRLMALSDNGKTSRYTYNAAGERIVKSHGYLEGVYVNGAPQGLTFHETEDYTIYPAPILSVTRQRFTKHYFIGDKRVASKIGAGIFQNAYGHGANVVTAGQKDYQMRMMQIEKQREDYYRKLGTPPGVPTMKGATAEPENTHEGYNSIIRELGDHSVPDGWIQRPKRNAVPDTPPGPPLQWDKAEDPDDVQPGYGYVPADTAHHEEIFFYHSDHLGSTSYITDAKANVAQFDAYLPYGELLVDEHSSSEEMPYKFNGKEFDEETGLYYYGARYMNPRTSLWYGVDPLAERYPSVGGYVYCAGNPVKLLDSDGAKVHVANTASFSVLLSSLPAGARSVIVLDKNLYLDLSSVEDACRRYPTSKNLDILKRIVSDRRTVDFDATSKTYMYMDSSGKVESKDFKEPNRSNAYQELMSQYSGPEEQRQLYSLTLLKQGIKDEIEVSANLGATLRPADEQKAFPGGEISPSKNFKVFINPFATPEEQAKAVGHEFGGHLYMYLIGKDPRHGGSTGTQDGNIELENQIKEREHESIRNFKEK